ncbi:NAC domain-containing protein 89-like [Dorcoceras hygrometricum]|uniref:NAC domain-containing protein 89-like n=1 Tax=Dorcoceras hygrometricum TaxID=472368 RepID=A0A2Z7A795_9LAMI|nr:NAC domain-containing protein 89-like [Dorcoceras hygrometricum]
MESDHQSPTAANPNPGGASNTEGTLAIGEVLRADVYRPNKQLVTYHRRITDGGYVAVHISSGFRFLPKDEELITDYLNKKINGEDSPCIRMISTINIYRHSPEELAWAAPGYYFSRNIRTPAASRSISQVVLQPLMGNKRKNKSQGFQRHQNRSNHRWRTATIGGN